MKPLIEISGTPSTYKLTDEVKKIVLRRDGTAIIVGRSRSRWGVRGMFFQGPKGFISGTNTISGEPFYFPTPATSLGYARKHGITIKRSRSKKKWESV